MNANPFNYSPPVGDLEIIYVDEFLLVVNKPAGLLSVPGRGEDKQDCLYVRLRQVYSDVLAVHRLDMATSGLMVFARGIEIQRCLSRMFREHVVQKRYVAVVAGKIAPETGEINLPILADWPNRPRQKIDLDAGKPSLTRYALVEYDSSTDSSHVELEPVTGRTHQLRIHMAAIGHPIRGDALYGDATNAPRLMLHASSLCFTHPFTASLLNFVKPFLSHDRS